MRYTVDPLALRDSATTLEEVLAGVQALGIDDALRPLAVAVPRGRTAAGLRHVCAAWQTRTAGHRWELRELGLAVAAAADAYESVDRAAAAVVGQAARHGEGR